MEFKVVKADQPLPKGLTDITILHEDNWDDWFTYSTMYSVIYFTHSGSKIDIGSVKIGQKSFKESQRRPDIPDHFTTLDSSFFSLGQSSDYYETLIGLPSDFGKEILLSLRDMVNEEALYEEVKELHVTRISLMRDVSENLITGRFHQIVFDGLEQTPYAFSFNAPSKIHGTEDDLIPIRFDVHPKSIPPTNIHAIIGRNGVGKTYLLNSMIDALMNPKSNGNVNVFEAHEDPDRTNEFTSLVSVSFSAFDDLTRMKECKDKIGGIKYEYIGLKRIPDADDEEITELPKTPEQLAAEFVKYSARCLKGSIRGRLNRALTILSSDRVFKESKIIDLFSGDDDSYTKAKAKKIFTKLSSGHKIVILTIVRLIECVDDRTLVIIDEPESHLHPPLLAAFARALSNLLANRNAVAIVATHSPVIVQEIPKNCVWKIYRNGNRFKFERPRIETFAEGYGTLSSEVFGLEVSESGYNKYITNIIAGCKSYEEAIQKFNKNIGSEGRSLILGLLQYQRGDKNA